MLAGQNENSGYTDGTRPIPRRVCGLAFREVKCHARSGLHTKHQPEVCRAVACRASAVVAASLLLILGKAKGHCCAVQVRAQILSGRVVHPGRIARGMDAPAAGPEEAR